MTSDKAELSTVATQLDDLVARITEVAERHRGTEHDDVSIRLFEVERSLISAARSLQSAQRTF
jgi:phenylpyruvate tautomerase PptA (4-oxalocrotonate tautomerase family)